MKKEIPIYDALITDKDDGLLCISLVDQPAMEIAMMAFEVENKPLQFAIDDSMEHCVTSVVIRADAPIYRYSPEVGEYYIRFSKEIIKQLAEKYSKDGLLNCVSVNHDGQLLEDITMVEFYIKDIEKGLDPKAFHEVEDGSLFCTFKINNEDVWKEVMNGEFGGFSMEVIVDTKLSDEVADVIVPDEEPEDDFWSWLMAILGDDEDLELVMSKDEKWLVNGDGEFWLDEDGNKVPAKCPKCGSPVGVYIKGEPVFLCSECGEYLGTVKFPDDLDFSSLKKKDNFRIKYEEADKVLKANRKVNITIGKQELQGQQVFELGKDLTTKKNTMIVYDPTKTVWSVYNLDDIKAIEITNEELENFHFTPSYKEITNNDNLAINKTRPSVKKGLNDKDNIDYAMDHSYYVMIAYDDEEDDAAKGFRTCFVSSWGETIKGNECIRVYEYSGDTKTGFERGQWRFMLTRRIKDFKVADYMQPITEAPPLYNEERQQNSGKNGTMQNVKRVADITHTTHMPSNDGEDWINDLLK